MMWCTGLLHDFLPTIWKIQVAVRKPFVSLRAWHAVNKIFAKFGEKQGGRLVLFRENLFSGTPHLSHPH
jgi:hypothetical protein